MWYLLMYAGVFFWLWYLAWLVEAKTSASNQKKGEWFWWVIATMTFAIWSYFQLGAALFAYYKLFYPWYYPGAALVVASCGPGVAVVVWLLVKLMIIAVGDTRRPTKGTIWATSFGKTVFLTDYGCGHQPFCFPLRLLGLVEIESGKRGPIDEILVSKSGTSKFSFRVFGIVTEDVGRENFQGLWDSVHAAFVSQAQSIIDCLPEENVPEALTELIRLIKPPDGLDFKVQKPQFYPAVRAIAV